MTFFASLAIIEKLKCECAGIGRQARLRGVCLWRTGSSPVTRTRLSLDAIRVRTLFYFRKVRDTRLEQPLFHKLLTAASRRRQCTRLTWWGAFCFMPAFRPEFFCYLFTTEAIDCDTKLAAFLFSKKPLFQGSSMILRIKCNNRCEDFTAVFLLLGAVLHCFKFQIVWFMGLRVIIGISSDC